MSTPACRSCVVSGGARLIHRERADVVGRNPVVLALNKADLLPRDFHPNRVKNW